MKSLAAALSLAALAILWHHGSLFSTLELPDETAYLEAFRHVLAGGSAYDAPRYFYTPAFARLGALAVSALGSSGTALALRFLNLAAVLYLAVASAALCPPLGRVRFAVALGLVVALRPLSTSIALGNVSPIPAALLLAAVLLGEERPIVTGILFGLGLAMKPAAAPALLVLSVVHRPSRARLLLVASASAVASLALLVDARDLPRWLERAATSPDVPTNLSPLRVLAGVGANPPSALVALVLTLGVAAFARRFVQGPRGLAATAGLAALLWSPLVWLHSFSLVVPAVVVATERAVSRFAHERSRRAFAAALWIGLAALAVDVGDALGDVERIFPSVGPAGALLAAIPGVAAIALVVFTTLRGDVDESHGMPPVT
ncbi:MAG TPA: glycosyltransferase 87 family protein [Polyangiaceae bacterium]|nr:glycosyltransferase 87 family protein [Polyangiaceae bacterium]